MDNYIQTIKQYQLTLQLAAGENKQLRDQLIQLQSKYDPDLDIKIDNLEKTILLQQQQIAQLKQEKIKNSRIEDADNEDEQFQIQQLNLKVNEKLKEIKRYSEQNYQMQSQLRNTQLELDDLQEQLRNLYEKNGEIKNKADQMEIIMKKLRGQEPLSLSYVNEIERLNTRLQQLEKIPSIQSRLTYQSYQQ